MKKSLSILFALFAFASVTASLALAQKPAGKNSKQAALLKTDIEFAKASVEKGAAAAFAWGDADCDVGLPATPLPRQSRLFASRHAKRQRSAARLAQGGAWRPGDQHHAREPL